MRRVTLLCCSNNSSSSVTCRTYKLAALGTVSIGCMVAALAGILLPPSLFKRLIADLDSGAKLKHHGMQEGRGALRPLARAVGRQTERRCHPNTPPPPPLPPLSRFCICRCQTWPRQASMVGQLPPSLPPLSRRQQWRYMQINFCQAEADAADVRR